MAFLKFAAWYAMEFVFLIPARHTSSFIVYRNTDCNLRFSIGWRVPAVKEPV